MKKVLVLSIMICTLFSCSDKKGKSYEKEISEGSNKYDHLINKDPKTLSYEELYNRTLTLWDIPYEERDIATTYGSAHVIISGPKSGKPLVLLHGMNSSSTVWYPNIESLSKNNRVYAIDFILETNKSKLKTELEDVENMIDWYYEIFEGLQLDTFSLCGASMGGWLAVKIALRNPLIINKMMLLSPAQTFIMVPPSGKVFKNFFYNNDREDLREVLQTITYDVDQLSQRYIDQYYRAITTPVETSLMPKMRTFNDNQLKTLTMPILLMIGDDDFINNDRSLKKAEDALSNVKTVKLEHCRHFLTVDKTEQVNLLMTDFLEQ